MSRKRIMVTGAGGIIGLRVANRIISENLGNDIEFLLAIDREEVTPWFVSDNEKEWLKQDLESVDPDWWHDTIQNYNIDTIYYIETNENINMFLPDHNLIERLSISDALFVNYLRSLYFAPEVDKINIVYISTDKLYQGDEFPNELNNMSIIQPEGNSADFDPIQNYATLKMQTELSLLSIDSISLRIIRPFSIVSSEQRPPWPLAKIIIDAMTDAPLYIMKDGKRGIVYTHADDLASFILHPKLFDDDILQLLSSRIINFCRTQNYLPEEFMVRKIKGKTESQSDITNQDIIDMFPHMMCTPQIRNMAKIMLPIIPIERIIEEFIDSIDPSDLYEPLIITGVEYIQDNVLQISGTAEPLAGIAIALGTGEHLTTDTTEDGSWAVQTEAGIFYEESTSAIAYATTEDKLQYDTVVFDVPAAPIPPIH